MRRFTEGPVTYVGSEDDVKAVARSIFVRRFGLLALQINDFAAAISERLVPVVDRVARAMVAFTAALEGVTASDYE